MRNKDPGIYRLITIRTGEARLWITPNAKVRRLIGGILARYQEIFKVVIYGYIFLGNHYHLLIKAPLGNADEFCENLNREISRRLNFMHHREGKLWSRRYDDQEVLTDDDLIEAFLYISTNPIRHGLVEDAREWTGLSGYGQALTGEDRKYSFYHYSAGEEDNKVTTHTLRLTPLPQHEHLSQRERAKELRKLLAERAEQLVTERRGKGLGFLGLAGIRFQAAGETPRTVARSPRPPCYTFNTELRREYRKQSRYRRELYNEASRYYRLGVLNVDFPLFTFKPPLHRAPRIIPFTPLTLEDLKNAA